MFSLTRPSKKTGKEYKPEEIVEEIAVVQPEMSDEFAGGARQHDDMTMIIVKVI